MSSKSFYHGVEDYQPQGKIDANVFTRNGYAFVGWNTASDGSGVNVSDKAQAEDVYDASDGATSITLYAQWVSIKLRKRGTGSDASENIDAIGSLYLLSSEDGYDAHIEPTQITETIGGVQSKAWLFAPKPNTTYRIGCTMATTGDDRLWAFSGVTDTQGNALTEIAIGQSLGNFTLNANFTRKTTKTVGTEVRSVVNTDIPPVTLAVTTPSAPDVTQLGGDGKYITGQQIVATATYATGAMGWAIYAARLARYNDAGAIISEDALVNQHVNADGYGTITVNPNQFDSNIVIVGVFDRVKCPLSANVHAASSHAFSTFTAQYLGEDGDWHNAVSSSGVVKYGEQVKLHVELADGGFQFEGLYVNGTKSALAPDENGDILYTLENALSFAFVVKAKVSVSMKVVHWADGAKTAGDCKVVLGGTASTGENPVVKDVTLGDTIAYGIDIAERDEGVDWLFDAWYNAVSGEQSYTDPVALQISNDAFAPTAPVDVVARVIDEYILYKTTISFVNEETQDEITAQTDFVESPQDADGKFVNDDNELEFDYQRGAMSVTLNFKETLPGTQLMFTKVQLWLYDEQSGEYGWADVYNEPSVGFMSNANRKLRALYGSAGNRTVSLAYANGSDRTMGDFFIAEADGNGKTIEAPRGSQITLRAVPANGYRFAGWYYAPQAIERIYESTEQVVTVKTTRTLYALFVQDTHAVYEWEGRSDNKMMTWRSKVYVAQIPFNPSAIRVDATDSRGRGTAVNRVEVGMMSSPDAAPAQSGLTVLQNMPNYVARRLPKRRPERYLYVEVQNDAEVDRIIVGTSMEGLRV